MRLENGEIDWEKFDTALMADVECEDLSWKDDHANAYVSSMRYDKKNMTLKELDEFSCRFGDLESELVSWYAHDCL